MLLWKCLNAFLFFSDMACSVAGITSDANVLTHELRLIAQRWVWSIINTIIIDVLLVCKLARKLTDWLLYSRYLLQYQEPIPCEQLVSSLCDIKQAYTQFGGKMTLQVWLIFSWAFCLYTYDICNCNWYLSFQGNGHLVCLFFTWVGTNIMASNCTKVTPVGISVAGKQPALEIIVWYVEESHWINVSVIDQ